MEVIRSVDALNTSLGWRRKNSPIGLLTVKGGVHDGHRSLANLALKVSDITVVNLHSDANRDRTDDLRSLDQLGIDFAFMAEPHDALALGEDHHTRLVLPARASKLCGSEHPGYFDLDVTMALKLTNAVQPQYLFFSDRDFQLATIIREVFEDLLVATDVMVAPAVREANGLVISNRYLALTNEQQRQAPILHQTLVDISHALTRGAKNYASLEQTARLALRGGGFRTEYITICDEETLEAPLPVANRLRIFAAAYLGDTRLTDNIGIVLQ